MQCEIHLQEGFTGETVVLSIDGIPRARVEARTRLQTGLARIETFDLTPGQIVTAAIPALSLSGEHRFAEGERWITVNRVEHGLVVRSIPRRPGYA